MIAFHSPVAGVDVCEAVFKVRSWLQDFIRLKELYLCGQAGPSL